MGGCVANSAWECRLILVFESFFGGGLCSEQFLRLVVDSVILVLESFVVAPALDPRSVDGGVRRVPLMSGKGKGGRTSKGKARRARRGGHWVSHIVPTPLPFPHRTVSDLVTLGPPPRDLGPSSSDPGSQRKPGVAK